MSSNKISTGNAGEYFVAGELERHGFTVAVPMSNVTAFDILIINRETNDQFAIQVKTSRQEKKWALSKKAENLIGDNIVYVFVVLNDLDIPEYHIVPSAVVAKQVYENHRKWLATPRKDGKPHNDTSIRNFFDKDDEYLNCWNYLGIALES